MKNIKYFKKSISYPEAEPNSRPKGAEAVKANEPIGRINNGIAKFYERYLTVPNCILVDRKFMEELRRVRIGTFANVINIVCGLEVEEVLTKGEFVICLRGE